MIPYFPNFKKIEIGDYDEVKEITKQLPPYSDFNFISMWSWDIKNEMAISKLHGNLVVKFTDYITGEPFFSFLGINSIKKTLEIVLEHDRVENNNVGLKLLPKEIITNDEIDISKLNIFEDTDHHDYIYSIELLSHYGDPKLKKHRNSLNSFLRKYPEARSEVINLTDKDTYQNILNLFGIWESNKNSFTPHEFLALKKCIKEASSFPLLGIGVFIGGELIGFTINQIESTDYAACFFAKANINYSGVYSYLISETARYLYKQGVKYLNYEQDLGLASLRDSKKALAPVYFLKKHCLKLR